MSHHHNNDLSNWQQQEQAQLSAIQSQIFWQGLWRAKQHRQTNDLLQQNQNLQQQNNALLEQIRRQLLTPAERAAEDRQRAAEAAKRAAEAEAEAEAERLRDIRNTKVVLIGIGIFVAVALFMGMIQSKSFSEVNPGGTTYASPAGGTIYVAPRPADWPDIPVSEQDANWQRILDMRAAAAQRRLFLTNQQAAEFWGTPTPTPTPRAQLVHRHH